MEDTKVTITDLDHLVTAFGDDEYRWLCEQIDVIDREFDDEPCKDNHRYALKGDQTSEAAFEERESHGCCGSYRTEVGPSPLGHIYLYGFNYGH